MTTTPDRIFNPDMHCENDSCQFDSRDGHTPGDWCPRCGEGVAIRHNSSDVPAVLRAISAHMRSLQVLIENENDIACRRYWNGKRDGLREAYNLISSGRV